MLTSLFSKDVFRIFKDERVCGFIECYVGMA